MIIDTSRFFWSAFTQRMDSFWNMYAQFKPLVMLPFNIWFFFASLPFRFFFYASSFFYSSKKPITQVKQKISLIKEEVNNTLPESLKSRAPIELRSRKPRGAFDEERPFHGFYAVEKQEQPQEKESTVQSRRNSFSKKESTIQSAPAESAPKTNELDTLRSRIADLEKEALKSSKEKSSLEQQLEGLEKKFKSGDAALAQAEAERKRFNNLISVEQRKCFDLQQQVVELNAQLKMEREAKQALQSKQSQQAQPEMKKAEGKKKQKKSSPAPAQSARTEQPSAWHGASHTQDYTDLVAKAQREELESGKTFVEVLKESSKPAETSSMSKKDEFTIVGGADSNHHVFAPVSAV